MIEVAAARRGIERCQEYLDDYKASCKKPYSQSKKYIQEMRIQAMAIYNTASAILEDRAIVLSDEDFDEVIRQAQEAIKPKQKRTVSQNSIDALAKARQERQLAQADKLLDSLIESGAISQAFIARFGSDLEVDESGDSENSRLEDDSSNIRQRKASKKRRDLPKVQKQTVKSTSKSDRVEQTEQPAKPKVNFTKAFKKVLKNVAQIDENHFSSHENFMCASLAYKYFDARFDLRNDPNHKVQFTRRDMSSYLHAFILAYAESVVKGEVREYEAELAHFIEITYSTENKYLMPKRMASIFFNVLKPNLQKESYKTRNSDLSESAIRLAESMWEEFMQFGYSQFGSAVFQNLDFEFNYEWPRVKGEPEVIVYSYPNAIARDEAYGDGVMPWDYSSDQSYLTTASKFNRFRNGTSEQICAGAYELFKAETGGQLSEKMLKHINYLIKFWIKSTDTNAFPLIAPSMFMSREGGPEALNQLEPKNSDKFSLKTCQLPEGTLAKAFMFVVSAQKSELAGDDILSSCLSDTLQLSQSDDSLAEDDIPQYRILPDINIVDVLIAYVENYDNMIRGIHNAYSEHKCLLDFC